MHACIYVCVGVLVCVHVCMCHIIFVCVYVRACTLLILLEEDRHWGSSLREKAKIMEGRGEFFWGR